MTRRLLNWLWHKRLGPHPDVRLVLGTVPQKGSLVAVVYQEPMWDELAASSQLAALARGQWSIERDRLWEAGANTLLRDVFGGPEDYGPDLLLLNARRGSLPPPDGLLTKEDIERADALGVHATTTDLRYRGLSRSPLNLELAERYPMLRSVIFLMAERCTLVAARYFVRVEPLQLFHSIRATNHELADELVAYLYDLLFLQQKTALAIHDFMDAAMATRSKKADGVLTGHELRAIGAADLGITYLKATIEKVLVVLAAIYGVKGVSDLKTHAKKLSKIERETPKLSEEAIYGHLLWEMVQSSSLAELNRYRTGLLHKKGIAVLQPHSYSGVAAEDLPHAEILQLLVEQHGANSACVVAVLALLVDELVKRAPPERPEERVHELLKLMVEGGPIEMRVAMPHPG